MVIVEIQGQVILAGSAFTTSDTGYDATEESLAPSLDDNVTIDLGE